MRVFYDCPSDVTPKRGDILQTNVGDRRERTFLILRSRRMRTEKHRFQLWAERWWQIEPDTRMRLYESAERNGGQTAHPFHRYPAKKKPRFQNGWYL